ncbi:MAG: hypothetical protein CVT81_13650 [Alphaproteobacteria bacterium HGW-Alphaproteobacteria-3]|nr:MAG: hypothetical protein CVT81_13650 [Alphaproteobacteria bacterium HGW-Alphaproteobacteria-3]
MRLEPAAMDKLRLEQKIVEGQVEKRLQLRARPVVAHLVGVRAPPKIGLRAGLRGFGLFDTGLDAHGPRLLLR